MKAEFGNRFRAWSAALGAANTKVLLDKCSELDLPANRIVIRDRMPVDSIYLVLDGEVDITVEENGRSVKLGSVGAGQVLGEVSVLSGELLASSTVRTATPVKLLRLRHQALEELIMSNYEVATVLLRHFVTMLADRLRSSAVTFEELRKGGGPVLAPAAAGNAPAPGGKNWLKSFFDRSPGG